MKVADLTVEELLEIVRAAVDARLAKFLGEDPDEGLAFREEFVTEVQARVAGQGDTVSLAEARQRLGLD